MTRTHLVSGSRAAIVAATLLVTPLTVGASPTSHSTAVQRAERNLEVADGAPARATRAVTAAIPSKAQAAWDHWLAQHGTWDAIWDTRTEVPLRIWGEGVPAPGAQDSPTAALGYAQRTLADQLALIAPGATVDDFVLVSNVVHGGLHGQLPMRTVGFAQLAHGAPVIGGQVSFLFKNDRLIVISSEAIPNLTALPPRSIVDASFAEAQALAAIHKLSLGAAQARAADHAVRWLPMLRESGAVDVRAVVSVDVELIDAATPGRWRVYVEAATGAVVARASLLHFGGGTITYHVPTRSPQRPRVDAPASFANFRIGATTVTSDAAGAITWTGTSSVSVTTALAGPVVTISNGQGAVASTTLSLAPGGTVSWDRSTVGTDDAQLSTFVFVNTVKAYAKANLAPNLEYLNQSLSATVNESGNCNAYSTGDDIHFYRASAQCENTGRIADVVFHEFGHSLHNQSIVPGVGQFEGALSEGVSDYLAATITGDHGMGRGFFFTDEALRDLDPVGSEKKWPDDLQNEVHADGEIIAGTLWDVRAAMIAAYGNTAGVTKADDIYYAIISRASDIPSSYAEALAADDDDGNLANGTPNLCTLREVFGRHGLANGGGATGSGLGTPVRSGFQVRVPIAAPVGGCAAPTVGTASLDWNLRGATGTGGTIALSRVGDELIGAIPAQADGSVVQYKVTVAVNGNPVAYPDNLADPRYEFFVGTVLPIYCTDFETDPGWTHGATTGTDIWQWGVPTANGGDPGAATSGTRVFGMDIRGGDGVYAPDSNLWTKSPVIATAGFTGVRLQYKRWLNVEDGFFDKATIAADGVTVWSNFNSNMGNNSSTSHTDHEWRFHDVDLTAQAADGSVQLTFALKSDPGLELGGWTLDDVCVVGYRAGTAACGNNIVEAGEQCDDGNTTADDGCSATCQTEIAPPANCGNGTIDAGEQCDDANTVGGDGCTSSCQTEPPPPGCGNGTVDNGEECDDGNIAAGDGCTSVCTVEGNHNPGDGDGSGCCSTGTGAGGPLTATGLGVAMAALLRRRRK